MAVKVLAGGLPGPFRYESYQIHAKEEGDSLDGSYRGVHVPSGHPIRLMFFGGDNAEHAHRWASIKKYTGPVIVPVTSMSPLRPYFGD